MSFRIVNPQTPAELPIFYLFWVLFYLVVNIIWDIRSKRTPEFHMSMLNGKIGVAFNAASFASSLLLVVGMGDPKTFKVAGDTMLPILLAGASGILFGLGEICPWKPQRPGTPTPERAGPPAIVN